MSQKKTHFWLPELYDLSLPPTCIIWSFCCGGLTYEWSSRHGDPHSSWFQALPNTEAASHWLVGPGHKVAGCRYLGVPRASTGSLVDRARFWGVSSKAGVPRSSAHLLMGKIRIQKFPGLVPDHWWMKPGPEASAGLLTDSSGS